MFIILANKKSHHRANEPDIGEDGPTLGPFTALKLIYGDTLRLFSTDRDPVDLQQLDGCWYYKGICYGDMFITYTPNETHMERLEIHPSSTRLPKDKITFSRYANELLARTVLFLYKSTSNRFERFSHMYDQLQKTIREYSAFQEFLSHPDPATFEDESRWEHYTKVLAATALKLDEPESLHWNELRELIQVIPVWQLGARYGFVTASGHGKSVRAFKFTTPDPESPDDDQELAFKLKDFDLTGDQVWTHKPTGQTFKPKTKSKE